jgi:hypothetical protein
MSARSMEQQGRMASTIEALNADIDDFSMERGHRTLAIVRKGGKHVTVPSRPAPDESWICTSATARWGRSSSVSKAAAWTATARTAWSSDS